MDSLDKAFAELKAAIEYGVKRSKGKRRRVLRDVPQPTRYKVVPHGEIERQEAQS